MAFYRITHPEHVNVQYLINIEHIVSIGIKPSVNYGSRYLLYVTTTNSEQHFSYVSHDAAKEAYDDIASYFKVANDEYTVRTL